MGNSALRLTIDLFSKLGKFENQKNINTDVSKPKSISDMTFITDFRDYIAPGSTIKPVNAEHDDTLFDGKPFIVFLIHHDSTSWIPVVPVLFSYIKDKLKETPEKIPMPFIFFHNIVKYIPLTKHIAAGMTGNTVSTYKEAVDLLSSDKPYCFATCPEGSNCLYDYDEVVAPFQQYGLIKAALASGAKICVITTKQEKPLAFNIKVPFLDFFVEGAKGIRLPYIWMVRNKVDVVYERMDAPMPKDEFNALTKAQQSQVVLDFGKQIKERFELRYSQFE